MKVLFLDVDGVLNSNRRRLEIGSGEYLDEEKVKLLSAIVRQTGAAVVLHSGWRFWFNEALEPVRREAVNLSSLLAKYGVRIYDKTPDFSNEPIRKAKKFSLVKADEILSWLENHSGVENYIVLDDLDLHNERLARRQIQTDSADGLTKGDVSRAVQMLNSIQFRMFSSKEVHDGKNQCP